MTTMDFDELHDDVRCPAVGAVLARIGDRWTVLIITYLRDGPKRFNEIKRGLGRISQRMLTVSLRALERDGLVRRTVTPTNPPRVDYALTELGHSVWTPVEALGRWALEHVDQIAQSQAAFDRRLVEAEPGPAGSNGWAGRTHRVSAYSPANQPSD